jgi:hypothetical protein
MTNKKTSIQTITADVTKELANKETMQALVATTFKGLEPANIKQAIVEGVMRGFTFQDFLEKNVYAIPYGKTYSLVTSIDYARKVGMRSGVVGVSAPTYTMNGPKLVSCAITVKRRIGNDIGEFTSEVFFNEYTTGRGLWTSKPRVMIAKVAEMSALRRAAPEVLSQVYTADEMADNEVEVKVKSVAKIAPRIEPIDVTAYGKKLEACKTIDELKATWSAIPFEAKVGLESLKEQIKLKLSK